MLRLIFVFPPIVTACVIFSVQSASAGCAEDIASAEKTRNDSGGGSNAQALIAFDRILVRAKQALEEGKQKRCEKLVKSALSKL